MAPVFHPAKEAILMSQPIDTHSTTERPHVK